MFLHFSDSRLLQVECSNGQVGFGRKRREIMQSAMDPNKIFEISMTTFIKVNYDEDVDQSEHWLGTVTDQRFDFVFLFLRNPV